MALNILDFAKRALLNTILTIIHPICLDISINVYLALIRSQQNLKTKLTQKITKFQIAIKFQNEYSSLWGTESSRYYNSVFRKLRLRTKLEAGNEIYTFKGQKPLTIFTKSSIIDI